jgi:two-component system, cell cycle response regulator DivK
MILVVEDDPSNQKLLQLFLQSRGYEVVAVENGNTAIGVIRERIPSLVLIDLHIPGIDGFELASIIRADDQLAHIPLVAVTARVISARDRELLLARFNGYLSKPVKFGELENYLARYVARPT